MNGDKILSSQSLRRISHAYLNGVIYVPEEGREVLTVLESRGVERFKQELERRAALGATWASAILGYLYLMLGSDGKRNPDRAVALCESSAKAGDPYALFVYAWALLYKGQWAAARLAMGRAIELKFSPAALAFADVAWNGWGSKPRPELALQALRTASRLGHKSAVIWRLRYYRSGRLGIARRLLGYLLAPFGFAPYWIALWRDPFSAQVFVFHGHPTKPLLLPKPRITVSKALAIC